MIDALFGSKTRVKLLYLFLNNPGQSFYVREITRKIDEQINSVRRELSNMLEVGIIKSDSKDNKLFYEVDTKYPFYQQFHQIFSSQEIPSETTEVMDELVKKLHSVGDVKVAILSGKLINSFDSEVDLLLAGDISKVKLKNLVKQLEEEHDTTLAYTALGYEEFYYRLSVRDQFICDILNSKHSVLIDSENIISKGE